MKIFPGMLVLGIDEAGRGSLLGPCIVVGVLDRGQMIQTTKDSKKLTPNRRTQIRDRIIDRYPIFVESIEAVVIDQRVYQEHEFNKLEAEIILQIIKRAFEYQPKIDHIVIDLISDHPGSPFLSTLREKLPTEIWDRLILEHRADENYHSVALASIVAKTTRDRMMEEICRSFQLDLQSGYPADPLTQAWIQTLTEENIQKYRSFIRLSWKTIKHPWKIKYL